MSFQNTVEGLTPDEFLNIIARANQGPAMTDEYIQKRQRREAEYAAMRQQSDDRAQAQVNEKMTLLDNSAKDTAWRQAIVHARRALTERAADLQAAGVSQFVGEPTPIDIFKALVEMHKLGGCTAFTPHELAQLGEAINGK